MEENGVKQVKGESDDARVCSRGRGKEVKEVDG